MVYLKEMKSKGICQIQEELLCVLSKLNIPFLQGLLCCHVYTQTNKCLTFFSDEGTVCASGAYYFKKHKWRERPNPSGTDGLNILILEPHGEKQGPGNRNGGLIREPGNSISPLKCFQGLQVCRALTPTSRGRGNKVRETFILMCSKKWTMNEKNICDLAKVLISPLLMSVWK